MPLQARFLSVIRAPWPQEKPSKQCAWFCLVHSDNVPFNESEFCNYIAHQLGTTQTFSGVRAHHQAVIPEHAIGTITS
jgi:hypothetical protein